jgi:hypothetical protein
MTPAVNRIGAAFVKTERVWFITGCSTGFGHALAHQILEQGGRAVLTARNTAQLKGEAGNYGTRALVLPLDVTDEAMIQQAVADAQGHFGRIDVLVNNAGYGYFAASEEGEDVEIRRQFETNVFGLFSLTRHVLAGMRLRRSGHIVNVQNDYRRLRRDRGHTSCAGPCLFGEPARRSGPRCGGDYSRSGIRSTALAPAPRVRWVPTHSFQARCHAQGL